MNCLILEDEKAAQEVLKTYIAKTPFTQCIGVYESGLEVDTQLLQQTQVLFLDIQLPEFSGLAYLKTLINPPQVIVTTAFSHYAVDAFEENVVDYLVKPFSYERFFKAINRVNERLSITTTTVNPPFLLYADKTIYQIKADEIVYLKAEVDYVQVVTDKQSILVLDSLRNWEEKLQNLSFFRVHRSYIVHTHKIEKIYGNQIFIGEIKLPISKAYREAFLQFIGYTK
ncbi:hypothetical protein BKI52_33205 [marine bacterium AO1-C]|nr:hypothetical protein BKI52_33205 [marine bacterium AO1-C]